MVDTPHWSS